MIEHVIGEERAFAQCHAATIAAIPGGVLVAWFGGTREGHEDVAIWGATRTAAGWGPARRLAKVADVAHWNPVLVGLDASGRSLALHFKVGRSIRRWRTFVQVSRDGDETWDAPRPVEPDDDTARGPVRSRPIRLRSGDWLAGASTERWRRWDAFFDRSANGIDGWQRTRDVDLDRRRFAGKGLIQPTLWESRPGRVHALFRSTDGRVHRSDSEDDGRTWSPAYPTNLPNNNSGLDVVRSEDGVLALACNPVPGNWAARTPLSILFSTDEGATWPERVDVETEPGEFSYPALVAHEGALHLAYTWNRRRIAYARVTPPTGGGPDPAEPLS